MFQSKIRPKGEFYYPPLEVEDFPQMDTMEWRQSPPRNIEEYIMDGKGNDCVDESRILEAILHLPACAPQDATHSNLLCMWNERYPFLDNDINSPNQGLELKIHK
jgi:hypothetical protein